MSNELTELYAARGVDISKASVISIHSMPTSMSILHTAGFEPGWLDEDASRKMDDDGVLHLPDLGLDPVQHTQDADGRPLGVQAVGLGSAGPRVQVGGVQVERAV